MNLEFVIQDLLHKKNFITIPGFGSFVSHYQAARIVKSDYVKFIPPSKTIVFNPLLDSDDGVLQNILIEEYQLELTDAQKEISLFVNQTKEILLLKKIWELQGIGTFFYDSQNTLQFQETSSQNYLPDSFGLSDFSLHILPKEQVLEDYISKKKEQVTPLHKKIIKTAFIASPIILGAILIPNILQTQQYTGIVSLFRDTEVTIDFSVPQKPQPIAFIAQSNVVKNEEIIAETTKIIQEKTSTEIVETPKKIFSNKTTTKIKKEIIPIDNATASSNSFFIIIGSFSTIENAKKLIKSLKNESFNAGILTNDNKIRVYISAFTTKNDAIEKLQLIKNTTPYSTAWIYTKES